MDETLKAPQIALKDTKSVACSCGSEIFQAGINLREVSAIMTGTGKNEIIPVQVVFCAKCFKKYEPSSIITPA